MVKPKAQASTARWQLLAQGHRPALLLPQPFLERQHHDSNGRQRPSQLNAVEKPWPLPYQYMNRPVDPVSPSIQTGAREPGMPAQ